TRSAKGIGPPRHPNGLRFHPPIADRPVLPLRTRGGRPPPQSAAGDRATPAVSGKEWPARARSVDARLLQTHSKYFSRDRTHHRTVCQRLRDQRHPRAFYFFTAAAGDRNESGIILHSSWPTSP